MSLSSIQIGSQTIKQLSIPSSAMLSDELVISITNALDQIEDADPSHTFLIRILSSDASEIVQWPGTVSINMVSRWERLLRRLERASFTTLVFCDGASSNIALELLLVADRRIVTSHFVISDLYFKGSIWPGMSLFRLCRQLGEARTRRLYFEAQQLTSSSAVSLGIADEVVDDYGMALSRLAVFLDIAPISDYAIRRRLMQDSQFVTFEDALGTHLAACDRALRRS